MECAKWRVEGKDNWKGEEGEQVKTNIVKEGEIGQ